MDVELVRYHCHGKKKHKTKKTHEAHGCTPKRQHPRRGITPGGGMMAVKKRP